MIRAAIIGGNSQVADELTRILIHHPDVHLAWIEAGDIAGNRVSDTYAGLVGDTDLRFVADGDVGEADVVFVCRHGVDHRLTEARLRVIDLVGDHRSDHGNEADGKYVYGLGELNRKPMVRGARRASVPSPAAHAAIVAMLPLAKAGKLYGNIAIEGVDVDAINEIAAALQTVDATFDGTITAVNATANTAHERAIQVKVVLPANDSADTVRSLIADTYDDHGFAFVVGRTPRVRDVANTNKCILSVAPSTVGNLEITAMLDPHVKGSAGTAVHCMNLLFGLYERTGLTLKPSAL